MATTYLTRTFGSATSRRKCTISFWIKKGFSGDTQQPFCSYASGNDRFQVYFQNSDQFAVYNRDNGNETIYYETKAKYRDANAWYHCYVGIDLTLSTAADRVKIYINGERQTTFEGSTTVPNQNSDLSYGNNAFTFNLGRYGGTGHHVNGILSHFYLIDGSVVAHTEFGETDSTTGEWKIKTNPTISSYGNQGGAYFIDDNSVNDQSGNNNHMTLQAGTLTKTEDCPSNVFATWNTLDNYYASSTFNYGNTALNSGGSGIETWNTSTLGASSGKYYFELKHNGGSGTPYRQLVGITQSPTTSASAQLGSTSTSWGYYDNTGNVRNNNSNISWSGNTWTQNDIIGVAMDLDNNRLFFSKNGTWQNSADPTTSTGAITITDGTYFFAWGDATANSNYCNANFGNGYFGTTAVASAGTNASGNGIFEYDCPQGYTALSTKGLNL